MYNRLYITSISFWLLIVGIMIAKISIFYGLFVIFIIVCYGNIGVDISMRYSTNDWSQLSLQLTKEILHASVHVLFYNQSLNSNAPLTLISAWNSGIRSLSTYAHPCVPGSEYDQQTESPACVSLSNIEKKSIFTFIKNIYVRLMHQRSFIIFIIFWQLIKSVLKVIQ